jgi:FtsP/CotA-like multicopper oxidase with cupredoxin domain
MARRDVYLSIEPVPAYSPLAPVRCARRYGRDFMRNRGHELGRVTAEEIFATTLDALVYREYLDPEYTTPRTTKLVEPDDAEPPWDRRVPGCVLYAEPGEQLHIHVRNGDAADCHSLHLHGVRYGIDSDGAWPLGVAAVDGRRSDEIRPGESWTYVFDVGEDTIGAWAFHDHVRDVHRWVGQGLFGGLIVRDPSWPQVDLEVPLFVHQMAGPMADVGFESPTLSNGMSWSHTFSTAERTYSYHCRIHGVTMAGQVRVAAGGPATTTVTMVDNTFTPDTVTVAPGGVVTWFNASIHDHIVFFGGGGGATYCMNGRAYVGNTPTIVGEPGQRLRWYLFNLDLGGVWHNFHPHSARWQPASSPATSVDVHALSPLESFVLDTVVPPALRLPTELSDLQDDPPEDACGVHIKGDFLFHCHIEEHMMQGLAGLVRSRQRVWLTPETASALSLVLPYDDGAPPPVDGTRICAPAIMAGPESPIPVHGPEVMPPSMPMGGEMPGMPGMVMPGMPGMAPTPGGSALLNAATRGAWELLPCDSQVLAVHMALLRTGKVLLFSGSGNFIPRHDAHQYGSVLWDYEQGTFAAPPITYDVFCAGQAFLPSGDLLVAGGTEAYDPFRGLPDASIFRADAEAWSSVASMADGRWYPTLVALGDGRMVAVSGTNEAGTATNEIPEVFDSATSRWTPLAARTTNWPLYPHLFLLRTGEVFFTGGSLGGPGFPGPLILDLSTGTTRAVPGLSAPNLRGQCASVFLPPAQDQRVMIIAGGGGDPFVTVPNADIVDLSGETLSYMPTDPLHHPRTHLNAVILPDRTVFVTGGGSVSEAGAVLEAEIYDPSTGRWTLAATARVPRFYHSVAVLLPDGRVVTAGSNPNRGDDELRLELYHPPYLFRGPRPLIDDSPEQIRYGGRFSVRTPQARHLQWVQITRPMATTHSCDSEQRLVDLPFTVHGLCELEIEVPNDPNLAPPGWYLLTIVDHHRIPSVARWVHLLAG